jgi:hypothetical protein
MSGFYIDISALQSLRHALGATESQMTAAFNKALRQTVNAVYKESVTLMLHTTGAKNRKVVQGRMRRAVKVVGSSGQAPGGGRIWFGLDDMPVSTLRGKMKSKRGIRPQDRKRDVLGRFLPARGGHNATFTPASPELQVETFNNSFLGVVKGRRSIWVRTTRGHVHEAKIAIYRSMTREIGESLSDKANAMLMDFFEKDLAGRIRGNVHLNSKGKRI